MSNIANNLNTKTSIFDITINLIENMNYIMKFRLPTNVTQHINSRLILHNAHIDDLTIVSDIKFNSYILYCFEITSLAKV